MRLSDYLLVVETLGRLFLLLGGNLEIVLYIKDKDKRALLERISHLS